ncbi:MAG: NADH-quinone oxidoreductase subunit N [Acidimicrobiia bacterium]|nr:NADH-quinone oxidoreductase subunit N [Acidimicrobiia bacterium]
MENAAFLPVAFEVVLLVGALVVLLVAVVADRDRRWWGPVAGLSFALAGAVGFLQWREVEETGGGLFFSSLDVPVFRSPMVVLDGYSAFAAMLLAVVGFVGLLAAWDLVVKVGKRGPEFVVLVLLAFAGLHMMTATPNLVVIFIGLETASIAFYVLAGFVRTSEASKEAALKYFLLGSLASALFLYGVALVFGATGSLSIYGANSIRNFFSTVIVAEPGILLAGMALMLVGLAFKVTAAPFHQWAPDVYQGAPTGAVGLMSAGIKVAAFAAIGRIFIGGFISQIDAWGPIVAVIAALSMIVGTFLALVQDDIKRLLAYSGVAHAGYILTALVAGVQGIGPMWFYLATYSLMVVGAFAVVSTVAGPDAGRAPLADFGGLAKANPELGWLMSSLVLGMAGIPFFAGFVGKVLSFTAAASVENPWPAGDNGYLWLVVLGTLTTVIGLAFYLRIISTMFTGQEPELQTEATLPIRFAVVISAVVTVVFGIVPWPLIDVVRDALPL